MFKKGHKHSARWYEVTRKPRPQHVKDAIKRAQTGRKHKPNEGFQKGHAPVLGTEKTRFIKGQMPWNKGKGVGHNPTKRKYTSYKASAKKRGFSFEVSLDSFGEMLSRTCVYCGDNASGIDRVDNSLGYIEGNMAPCCGTCNHMKWVLSKEEFVSKCRQIIEVTGYEI